MKLVKLACIVLVTTAVALFAISCAGVTGSEPAASDEQPTRPMTKVTEPPADPDAPVSSDDPAAVPDKTGDADRGEIVTGEASVENVQINIMESFPLQASAQVQGYLNDGCTELGDITVERSGNTFNITLEKQRPADAECTQAIVEFEENIPLDILGLEAGEYTVDVNGVTATFTLPQDNVLPEEDASGTPPVDEEPGGKALPPIRGLADVEQVSLSTSDGEAPDLSVIATGFLRDGCTHVGEIGVRRDENVFLVVIGTERNASAMCTLALVNFKETIPLDISGLDDGAYTVRVNGVEAEFTLENGVVNPGSSDPTS